MGAFKTTPIEELHHLASIPPIKFICDQLRSNAAFCFWKTRHHHKLPTCASRDSAGDTNVKWLESMSRHIGETILPFAKLPWDFDKWLQLCMDEDLIKKMIDKEHTSRQTLIVYTDRSQDISNGFRWVGAGAVMYRGLNGVKNKIAERKWGGGRRATVYDAEMMAIAGGMRMAVEEAQRIGLWLIQDKGKDFWFRVKHIILVLDNQSAVRTIAHCHAHAMQVASLLFCSHLDSFLQDPTAKVTVAWAHGHSGVARNKMADKLVKEAWNLEGNIFGGATLTWAKEWAKKLVEKHWVLAWQHRTTLSSSAGNAVYGRPPSWRITKATHFFMHADRRWGTHMIQTLTSHGWYGGYYQRFNINDTHSCPCGEDLQTRPHILEDCPLHDKHRHFLDPPVCTSWTMSTSTRRWGLLQFLQNSNTFFKTIIK
jgi:ribonuclease HI